MFFISNALILVLVSFHFTSTVFDSLVFPDLKDVEPAEGRLEFLAYLVNEEQHNQSVQVKYLRKQDPQTSSNTLTQFFIVSRLPEFSALFHFFFRYLLICFQFILPAFTFWVTREWFRWQDYWTLRFWFRGQAEGVVKKKTFTDYFQELMNPSSFPKSIIMQIWYVKPLHLELKRKTKPFKFKYCLLDIKF